MATTALQFKDETGNIYRRIKIMTVKNDNHIDVDIYLCNDSFIPIGKPEMGVNDKPSEEIYHKELRSQSSERGQYVPEESTNNEWDPGAISKEDIREYTLEEMLTMEYGEIGTERRDEFEKYYQSLREQEEQQGEQNTDPIT